jgi:hypothetical protein
MRVNPVIINKMAGKNDNAVKNSKVWMGTEKLVPLLPDPTSTGKEPAAWARAEDGNASKQKLSAKNPRAQARAPQRRVSAPVFMRASSPHSLVRWSQERLRVVAFPRKNLVA